MKTEITHKIQSWKHRNYCKANILLAYMALISLGSFIGISVLQLFYEKQNVKNLAQKANIKQQAKELAYITFLSLKKIATSNTTITFVKEDHLHFYKIQDGQLEDLGHLDSDEGVFSIKIQPCLTESLDDFCNFGKDGIRLSLDEILKTTAEWGDYVGLKEFSKGEKETICKRWEALKNETEMPSPLFLFEPVITEVTQTACNVYNPYDRKLTGPYTFCLEIDEDSSGTHTQKKWSVCLEVNLAAGTSQKISYTQPADQQNLPCYPCPSTLLQWDDLQPLSYHKRNNQSRGNAKWRHAIPAAQSAINFAEVKRKTENWLDRLNTCFNLDNMKEAYTKVGNIKNFPKLNTFLWNEIIPDKQTKPFYFNGTQMQILEQLQDLFKEDLSEDQRKKLCNHIYEKAPYSSGLKFIEQFLSFDSKMAILLHKLLHKFTAICSRVEVFSIEISYKKNKVFQLNVMRDPKLKQWYIIQKREVDTVVQQKIHNKSH